MQRGTMLGSVRLRDTRRRALHAACFALAVAFMLVAQAFAPVPAAAASSAETQVMWRLYNPNTGEHFYTANTNERDRLFSLGWNKEGQAWVAPVTSSTPVYRLYNPVVKGGDHHYTTNANERDMLVGKGWHYEGIGWYSDDAQRVALQRLYNPHAETGTHHYTVDTNEADHLAGAGWRREGVAWYAVALGSNADELAGQEAMRARINGVASATNYLLAVDTATCRTGVFRGSQGAWQPVFYWQCGPGTPSTPTVKGEYTVTAKGYSFGHGYTCYYYTQFYGDYLFHSIKYDQGTFNVQDGRLGTPVSEGCVRLSLENAKWIWDNIPLRTKVVIW